MTTPTTFASDVATWINYVEIWGFNDSSDDQDENSSLVLETAVVIENEGPRTVQPSTTHCPKGSGIVGSAWLQEAPVIMQGDNAIAVQTVRHKSGMNIQAMLAFPVFCDFKLVNVIVFGLGTGNGGLEIWTRDDRDELAISGSFYRGLSSFEYISQFVRFPKGAGLPGACWKQNRPKIIQQPDVAPNFIRSFDRDPSHLAECVGLPIGREYGYPGSILLLLSDAKKPFAETMDIWQRNDQGLTTSGLSHGSMPQGRVIEDYQLEIFNQLVDDRCSLWLDRDSPLLPPKRNGGLFVPFFDADRINDVLVLLF